MTKDEPKSTARLWAAVLILAAALALAYGNSFSGAFVLDDLDNIVHNRTIRALWPPWSPFFGPMGHATAGRPLVNASLAVNYAVSSLDVWSYHLFNLLVHLAAALALFGLVRRTLCLPSMRERFGGSATNMAFAAALLWALHPLCTQAVTYVIQRYESMMGLFFFLTLYCAVRGWEGGRARWHALAVAAMILGVGSKEVIVAAPVAVFLYDRVFMRRSLAGSLRASPLLYGGLAAGCALLILLVKTGGTASSISADVARLRWTYLSTQAEVIVHYLKLAFWPSDLVMDYGWPFKGIGQTWPQALFLAALFLTSLVLWWKRRPAGFLGLFFFVALAPSSSFRPQLDPAFEYRMYVPLAAVIVFTVFVARRLILAVFSGEGGRERADGRVVSAVLVAVAAVGLGLVTFDRNRDYRDAEILWKDTLEKSSTSLRADFALANLMREQGRLQEAVVHYRRAIPRMYDTFTVLNNLGLTLLELGQNQEAAARIQEALLKRPDYAPAHANLGLALMREGKTRAAEARLRQALALDPDSAPAELNLGILLLQKGEAEEGLARAKRALALEPADARMRYNLAVALNQAGKTARAADLWAEAIRLDPGFYEARVNLASALLAQNDLAGAVEQLEKAVTINPGSLEANYNLGNTLMKAGKPLEAARYYEAAAGIAPGWAPARLSLCIALARGGKISEALAQARETKRLFPNLPAAKGLVQQLEKAEKGRNSY